MGDTSLFLIYLVSQVVKLTLSGILRMEFGVREDCLLEVLLRMQC